MCVCVVSQLKRYSWKLVASKNHFLLSKLLRIRTISVFTVSLASATSFRIGDNYSPEECIRMKDAHLTRGSARAFSLLWREQCPYALPNQMQWQYISSCPYYSQLTLQRVTIHSWSTSYTSLRCKKVAIPVSLTVPKEKITTNKLSQSETT